MKSSKFPRKSVEIAERVYLKPAVTGDAFHYYFTLHGKQFRASTKTCDKAMRFALDYEWISKQIKIKHQSEAQSHNRRPHFTLKQYERLVQVSEKRKEEILLSAKKNKDIGLLTVKHWNRSILHEIIVIIANTGLRVFMR